MPDDIKALLSITAVILIMVAVVSSARLLLDGRDQRHITECIAAAESTYDVAWEGECERLGRGAECALPEDIADTLKVERIEAKKVCALRY